MCLVDLFCMLYHVTAVKGNTATVNVRARNHSIVIDEPVEQGRTDMGMNPVELLLSGVASCLTLTISIYAEAMGTKAENIEVQVDGVLDSAGMTLEEAVAAGIEAVEARTVVTGNGRNVILGGERAMMKLVADAQTHRLLGAHIMCAEASEMLSQFTEAIANCMTVEQLMRVIHPHPTFEESIQGALRELKEKMDEAQT